MDRELLLEFFLTFAKFEFALKNTAFFVRHLETDGRVPPLEPDWDRFAVSLREVFRLDRTVELAHASRFLLESPPNKQVLVKGAPDWETPIRSEGVSDIEFLIRLVRVVRNNLFHGGKVAVGLHESQERTARLLISSMIILRECLRLAPAQDGVYKDAVL